MDVLTYQHQYAVPWDQVYGQPVDYAHAMKQQYGELGPKTPPEYKQANIPQILANGQAAPHYELYPYAHHHISSQPLTPVLSSNSSQISMNMAGATSPALSNASSLPHSPMPQPGAYGQLGMMQGNGMALPYGYDVYGGSYTPMDAQSEVGTLQEAQQHASMQMMNGFGMMPLLNSGMQSGTPMNQPSNRTVYVGE